MNLRIVLPRVFLGFSVLGVALWLALNRDQLDPAAIEGAIRNLSRWGPVAHIVLFALGTAVLTTVAFLPRLLRRFRNEEKVRWIEVGELAPRLDEPKAIAVIDVRGPHEFIGRLGHIPGARNVPLAELPGRVGELESLTEAPIVLVCQTDKRSASAAALLVEAGFRDVAVLRGGMVRWDEAGLPVADRMNQSHT
jgi:rhodanese-related sulfurtransferase